VSSDNDAGTGAPRGFPGARRRGALVALAVGVALLVVAVAVAWAARPAPDVGGGDAIRLAEPGTGPGGGPEGGSTTRAGGSPAGSPGRVATPPPVRSGALPRPVAVVPPRQVRIPAIGVTARVEPVGVVAAGGLFEVPRGVDRVGWYRFGPGLEARAGSVVIAGHVDGRGQGRGAFFRLRELERGDRLTVAGADGRARPFRVIAREDFAKEALPVDRLFARDGAPRLTLITCGGPFDRTTRTYRDNLVVTAVPA
jgi:hypothetical protein